MRRLSVIYLFVLQLVSIPIALYSQETDPIIRMRRPIPNEYLVRLRAGLPGTASDRAAQVVATSGGAVRQTWNVTVEGFWFAGTENQARAIARNPFVQSVEENAEIQSSATQSGAPWDLDRIDQVDLPLSGTFSYCSSGFQVKAYVLDTGIRRNHHEFWRSSTDSTSRVETGVDFVGDGEYPYAPCDGDVNESTYSHGTSVASLIGGLTYGAAKAVTLVPVRVKTCAGGGSTAWAASGAEWVGIQESLRPSTGTPAVANLSFYAETTDPNSTLLEAQLATLMNTYKVTIVTSANNFSGSACNYVPSRMAGVITVAASNRYDQRYYLSNGGSCVDIFAPGEDVESAYATSDTAVRPIDKSGTSWASPLVTAAAARYLESYPEATPTDVWNSINAGATMGRLQGDLLGAPNKLLFISGNTRCRPLQ